MNSNYPKSAYIHIPFCSSKCYYCAFVSTCNLKLQTGYLISLLKDIHVNYKQNEIETLYFGGGTPSLLPIEHVKKIITKFNLSNNSEVTFELNPENTSLLYLQQLLELGVNRLSIGIQTFNDSILKNIGRHHDSEQAINSVKLAQKSGFKNISLDFIYGLPNQTLDDFINDLKIAKNLNIQHISLYGLKIENNTVFKKHTPNNLPDDDLQADMYIQAINELDDYVHYEISNFAINKIYASKHNINYWKNNEYYGFGCAAHGYENGIRYANAMDIKKYIEDPLVRDYGHTETEQEKLQEEIFLGFRLSKGINIAYINNKYNIDFEKKFCKQLKKYSDTSYILKTEYGYKLSNEGFLISNIILADFI